MKKVILTVTFLILGTFLFQGFQCASPEMQSASLYYRQKDFNKARQSVEKELAKKPKNGDAWLLLAKIESKSENYLEAAEALKNAEKNMNMKNKNNIMQVMETQLEIWTNSYINGLNMVGKYENTGKSDSKLIDKAIKYLIVATEIRPNYPELWRALGIAYADMKDDAKKIEAYKKYVETIDKDIQFAIKKGLFIGMSREQVIAFLGQPNHQEGVPGNGDSLYADMYNIEGAPLYIFSKSPLDKIDFKVIGWSYNPPNYWHPNIKKQPRNLYTDVMIELARYYYEKKDYDKALGIISKIVQIDPGNNVANNFLITIYTDLGKQDEAIKFIEDLMKRFPNNENYLQQHGTILAKLGRYDEAIESYKKAIAINPNMPNVLRNLAVSYKNEAVAIQKKQEELEKESQKPKDPEEYRKLLQEAAVNYEKALRTDEYKNSYSILADLADIYYVLDAEPELVRTVKKLEAIENAVPPAQRLNYYSKMIKIYDRSGKQYKDKEFFDTFPTKLKMTEKKMKALE